MAKKIMTAAETEAKEKKDAAAREKQFSDDPIKPEDIEKGSALCLGVGFLFFAAATTVSILIIVGAIVDGVPAWPAFVPCA